MSRPLFSCSSLALDNEVLPASSVLAIDTAGRLERELAATITFLGDPDGPVGRDGRSVFLLRSLETVISTARLLRQLVLDATCRSTDGSIEVHERGIRARATIVMRALYVFKQHAHEVPATALVAPFLRVHDVCAFLIDHISEICSRWNDQRGTGPQADPSTHRALRYIAADEAEIAFERLGRDAAFATFLRVGATCTSSDAVRTACREIGVIVGLTRTTPDRENANHIPGSNGEGAS